MTYKTKNEKYKNQMIEIAWTLVNILDTLTTKLWSIFAEEFAERINQDKEKEIPF